MTECDGVNEIEMALDENGECRLLVGPRVLAQQLLVSHVHSLMSPPAPISDKETFSGLRLAGERPEVSVVLPVRNGARTLPAAVASIRGQTFSNWELIVVDDGSGDGTAEVAHAIARDEPRLRVLSCAGSGIVAALNTGLGAARGAFIARMDADDESLPERLAEQVAMLRDPKNHAIGLVGCLVEFGGDRGANAGYALHVEWTNSLLTPDAIARDCFIESPFAHPSVMFRRELVARHGGYSAGDFPEDYELWLRWLDAGVRMAKVPRVLLRWNDSAARLSRVDSRYHPEAFFRVKAGWVARWLKRELRNPPSRSANAPADVDSPNAPRGLARPLYVWGAGRPTRKRAAHLAEHGVTIAGYVDVDVKKTTPAIGGTGLPVISYTALPPPDQAFVLGYVTSRGAREFIRTELRARRYEEGRDFLMCA